MAAQASIRPSAHGWLHAVSQVYSDAIRRGRSRGRAGLPGLPDTRWPSRDTNSQPTDRRPDGSQASALTDEPHRAIHKRRQVDPADLHVPLPAGKRALGARSRPLVSASDRARTGLPRPRRCVATVPAETRTDAGVDGCLPRWRTCTKGASGPALTAAQRRTAWKDPQTAEESPTEAQGPRGTHRAQSPNPPKHALGPQDPASAVWPVRRGGGRVRMEVGSE